MLRRIALASSIRPVTSRGLATAVRSYADTIPALGVAPDARVLVTGFTGKASTFHCDIAMKFGTNIVGGAVAELRPDVISVFVPPAGAAAAILEAIKTEVPLIVSVAEGIPAHDQMRVHQALQGQSKSRLVGANCPGLINVRGCKLGIQPLVVHTPGCVGIAGRSGTLTYEAAFGTSSVGLGQSFVFGLGGDLYPGTTTVEALQYLLTDEYTTGIVLIGEIGGSMEQEVAAYLAVHPSSKPIVGLIAGGAAPANRTLGHAGAIWELESETAESKRALWRQVGIEVVATPGDIGRVMKSML
ncbi:hypothetical protein RQP46_009696 [Phenoliferia psychrophenolica]